MPAATVCGSAVLKSASSAFAEGSSVLVGGAPGSGGLRLKSGGITNGALVVTANSSGDFLFRPAARRIESHPLNVAVATLRARMVVSNLISNLVARFLRGLRLKHIIQDGHRPQRDCQVRYIEHIPVIAEAVKVEKIRDLAIYQPVDKVPKRAPNDQAETGGQGAAGGSPQPPAKPGHRDQVDDDQGGCAPHAGGREQAIGNARIPDH